MTLSGLRTKLQASPLRLDSIATPDLLGQVKGISVDERQRMVQVRPFAGESLELFKEELLFGIHYFTFRRVRLGAACQGERLANGAPCPAVNYSAARTKYVFARRQIPSTDSKKLPRQIWAVPISYRRIRWSILALVSSCRASPWSPCRPRSRRPSNRRWLSPSPCLLHYRRWPLKHGENHDGAGGRLFSEVRP